MLFVFLKASNSKRGKPSGDPKVSQGGELQAIMCVDKTPDELSSFSNLVREAEKMGQDWHIVLIAGLAGHSGIVPSSDDAEPSLKKMVYAVESGGDLSKYMAFDKDGAPIQFQ